jgi:hypothetical protein
MHKGLAMTVTPKRKAGQNATDFISALFIARDNPQISDEVLALPAAQMIAFEILAIRIHITNLLIDDKDFLPSLQDRVKFPLRQGFHGLPTPFHQGLFLSQ